jgi:hypothetical protein
LYGLLIVAVVGPADRHPSVVFFGGFELGWIRARTPQRLIMQFAIALALLLAISPRARSKARDAAIADRLRASAHDPRDVAVARPACRTPAIARLGLRPLRLLYDYVPGFNGVRVPARYAMIAGSSCIAVGAAISGAAVSPKLANVARRGDCTRALA